MMGLLSITILFLLLPLTLAYRDGARVDSCYDHDVMHATAGIPPFFPSNCMTDPDCNYELTWSARVFDNMTDETTNFTELECGRTYRLTLNPGSGIGFLIQVRTDTGQTSINAAADIWGTFLDMDGDNYQPLQCGINQNMPNNRSNNSATHIDPDLHQPGVTDLFWRAPNETNADSITVTVVYTIVEALGTFYLPLFVRPAMNIVCPEPTEMIATTMTATTMTETTSPETTPTTSPPSSGNTTAPIAGFPVVVVAAVVPSVVVVIIIIIVVVIFLVVFLKGKGHADSKSSPKTEANTEHGGVNYSTTSKQEGKIEFTENDAYGTKSSDVN